MNGNLCILIIMFVVFIYVFGDKYYEDDDNI